MFEIEKTAYRQYRDIFRLGLSSIKIKVLRNFNRQLEIGSGPKKRDDWLTLDMCKGADVYWDLRHKLPFEESSFNRIYCSHVLEHFSYVDLMRLLREIHRVLVPGGEFLIAVPDASFYVDAYLDRREFSELLKYKPAVISAGKMDGLNYIFYMDGQHRFMFDAENLAFHCDAAGFVDCVPRPFNPSLDCAERDYESLYMSCRKQNEKAL